MRISRCPTSPPRPSSAHAQRAAGAEFAETSPFQVGRADLDPKSPSGFKWTSSLGPPIRIGSGTFCTVQIIVERRKPISYVIPMIKQAVGAT